MQDFLVDNGRIIAYSLVIFIFSLGIILSLIKQYKHDRKLRDPKYKRTVGDIIDFKRVDSKNKNGRKTSLYYAIVEFEDEHGKRFRYVSEDGTLTTERKNTRIPIYYNVDDPTDSIAQTNYNGYWGALICLIFGAVFVYLVSIVIDSGIFSK